ncbi:glycosyl transferase family 2 [Candidatus Gottesmanbacteria bacterium RIFCSPHIGHO2_02_FULL_39_14]|uniref:Glycosyl transferase family 2 n=3 Tax=Candidatus Gottesmaniibacteriota TaxID=1752720 RepID=A0A1F5ZVF1_9BACT|nr:MAG: glycosyl transferase family 2 [Candidatus Gottesmanbacteria bacterium RBG_16_38_7b]OGG16324.1 MAG: glycosyl transferase family 2 [Candidatus Gottesmanbacteria bacterium RIFCSPHIGHO2_02_FULL_39_14]OGG31399.1 MAG: glycosyl transferase family 2 [Candidatus Gottesmanbacteria bacterium RIFCSPLOWO2_02_FULL_38_8]
MLKKRKINLRPKVVVVMPAYNAAGTLEKTYRDIPPNIVAEVIVVDDDSHDETVQIARQLKLRTFVHRKNLGYGANQKTCYKKALERHAGIVVMIHPDYQYDATLTKELVAPILDNRFDIMLGSRIRSRSEALAGGMPAYKYFSNRLLTFIENIILGLNLSEYHTGFRAYKRSVLETLPLENLSDDFVFDQEILISAHRFGFTIGEIPVPVRYFPQASSINFSRSVKYGLMILYTLLLYLLDTIGIPSKIFHEKN